MKFNDRGRAAAAPASGKKKAVAPVATVQAAPAAVSVKAVVAAAQVMRPMTTTVGATALQAAFDAEPQVLRQPLRPGENVVVPISRRLRLVQLTERTCKWPNGDPLSEDFSFCGNDCAEAGPYCRYHAKIAFQPASERRRVR